MARRSKAAVVTDYRREQILNAACRSFARHGLHATTVDQIARAAGVAKGTVYLYYRSKEDLLGHALTEGIAGLRTETLPIITSDAPLEARLRRFLGAMIAFFNRRRDLIELYQSELTAEMRLTARRKWGQIYAAQTKAWEHELREAAKAHAIARVHPARAALAIVSLAHGLAIQHLKGWTSGPLDDDIAEACALLWKGLSVR
jgi:TetR/AcrR family fatty acid metabolism transcriptional regulator